MDQIATQDVAVLLGPERQIPQAMAGLMAASGRDNVQLISRKSSLCQAVPEVTFCSPSLPVITCVLPAISVLSASFLAPPTLDAAAATTMHVRGATLVSVAELARTEKSEKSEKYSSLALRLPTIQTVIRKARTALRGQPR